jgi:hypothetical protein
MQMVEQEFPGPAAGRVMAELGAMSSLEHKHASAELTSAKVAAPLSGAPSSLPIPPAPQQQLTVDSMGLPSGQHNSKWVLAMSTADAPHGHVQHDKCHHSTPS